MANTGVQGRIVNERGEGLGDLIVEAYDVDVLTADDLLGSAVTSSTGDFKITYAKNSYGLEARPDIRLRCFDPVKRFLYQSEEFSDVSDPILNLSTPITIQNADATGWLVTLRTGIPQFVSQGNFVVPIIDNEVAWQELTKSAETATKEINFQTLYFDIPNLITVFNPSIPADNQPTTGSRLEEKLLEANKNRGVTVRMLINDFTTGLGVIPILERLLVTVVNYFIPIDTADRVDSYFEKSNSNGLGKVSVRLFARPIRTPMHAKFAVIDGVKAYLIGSPLTGEYFDSSMHKIDDPRRGHLGGTASGNTIKVPIHDVGLSIQGPAVDHVNETFFLHWNQLGTAETRRTTHVPPLETNASVQIVRTLPGKIFPGIPEGETGILEAYQRAIRNASQFIYLENQYFTEDTIAEALFLALKRNTNLQLIMLINNKVDIPFYPKWQPKLLRIFLSEINTIGAQNRVGIFTRWIHEATPSGSKIIRNYVHSKVAVVDDKWATIGSANLDGVSLNRSQHIFPPITANDKLKRAVEVNALLLNNVDGLPGSPVPDQLRRTLWAEHLGFNDSNGQELTIPPVGGWLSLWKDRANAKLEGLKSSPTNIHPAFILPFGFEEEATKYLLALAPQLINTVHTDRLRVKKEVRSFSYKTGIFETKEIETDDK